MGDPSASTDRKSPISRTAASRTEIATPRRRKSRRNDTPWESDAELVEQILGGSRTHFDLLYEAYFPRVYRFALKRLRDPGEAEDVTQEVFVTVFKALQTYAGTSSLLVWIFGITRNKVNRRFRGVRPRFESIDAPAAQELPTPGVPTDRAVDARRMLARCEMVIETQLTPLQRRIFHLKHLRRQSIRSIAGSLGKSEDAVKANLYRMRRAIAQAAPGLEQILQA
ncbi:MAG: RNA polymerase sigma factor [bacterium]|nr:RNA polymerase sigma factor [bacterium]